MCCCCGRVLTVSSAFASPLHPAAADALAPRASLVRALADCTRARARTSLDAVHVALNLTWWCRYCSWTGRQRHRRRAARCSSTVSPMLPPSVEPALCLSGKGGCRPLVKCLAYVVRSRCCPCQAVYARTSASQDPAKALCSTRRRSRLAGLVCAAWWRSPLPALPPPPLPPPPPRSELHLLSARQQPPDVLHCGDAWWA